MLNTEYDKQVFNNIMKKILYLSQDTYKLKQWTTVQKELLELLLMWFGRYDK